MLSDLISFRKFYFLFAVSALLIIFNYLIRSTYLTEAVFLNSFSENLSEYSLSQFYSLVKKYELLGYALIPFVLFVKIIYNSLCVTTATLLTESKQFNFEDNFNICSKAEIVFILMFITKILFFTFFIRINTVTDIAFVPGSLHNLFKDQTAPYWATYLLDTINIWEVLFCILGAALFARVYNTTTARSIRLFVVPYIMGLIILMVLNAFFAILIKP